ncbi:MAG: MFS transporter [Oscillospiraceae bacterium]|nr:MFS transporter [Oscillospiraceae bacterium]MBQ7130441.1 MFS transporter [Oscillospiraceae bacterium]
MTTKHPEYMTKPIERLSYWTYFVGQNIYYNITAAFISTYLAMQGISLAKVATVLLIVKIWDAVNDPIFGFIFDKVKFKNGQKSLPWLRVAVLLIPIVTIILFSIPSGLSETGKLLWFGIAYLLWDTVYTLTDVPAYAMLNTMTDNLQERNLLLSVNRVFSGGGVLIYGVVLPLLISEQVGMSSSMAIAVMSIFSAITMVPLCLKCKERNYKPSEAEENFTPRQMFTYLKSNKYLLIYYCGYMATDALKTFNAVLLFVSFFLFNDSLFSIVLNILNMVPGVFAAMAMPTLLKRFDKFKTLFWCNIVCIVLGLVIYFTGYDSKGVFLTLTCIRTIPMSIVGILAFMFTPDCAEYGEYKSGISAKGITFAIQTFSVKITGAISSSLALFLLGLFGWITVEAESFAELEALGITQSAAALNGLWIVYALVPVIGMIISTFFYLGYKLNDKDVQIMAKCNAGEITREEAKALLSREY